MRTTEFDLLESWSAGDEAAGRLLRTRYDVLLRSRLRIDDTLESIDDWLEEGWLRVKEMWLRFGRRLPFDSYLCRAADAVQNIREWKLARGTQRNSASESSETGEPVSDYELLKRWSDRKEPGVEKDLFRRYYGLVWRYFSNKVPDADTMGDLIQRVFLELFRSWTRLRDPGKLRAFVYGIARNVYKNYYRRFDGHLYVGWSDDEVWSARVTTQQILGEGVETIAHKREANERLLTALRCIPIECQEVIELRYWEGLSDSEIARCLNESLGTVKGRLAKAKRLLREQLGAA